VRKLAVVVLVLMLSLVSLSRGQEKKTKKMVSYEYSIQQRLESDGTSRLKLSVQIFYSDNTSQRRLYTVEKVEPEGGKQAISKARKRGIAEADEWLDKMDEEMDK
jgi:hypothetical protein